MVAVELKKEPEGHLAVYRDLTGDRDARLPRGSMETVYLAGSHTKKTVRRLVDRINDEYQRRQRLYEQRQAAAARERRVE